MDIETITQDFHKVRATNYSTNGYPTKIIAVDQPSGDGVVLMRAPPAGGRSASGLFIAPFGAGADTNTFSVRVIGWRKCGTRADKAVWVPVTLCEIACTMTTAVGLAGMELIATDRFCDTLAVTKGTDGVGVDAPSMANDTIAGFSVDCKGFQIVEIVFTTGGSATSCNALYAKY